MSYRNVNPAGAKELLEGGEDWTYVDVRTVEEFDAGHAPDAYNIPVAFRGPMGMELNPDFVDAMKRAFSADAALVLGCAAGGRSARACEMLVAEGFTKLANMHGGYSGARDPSGQVTEAGWEACGFEVTSDSAPERTWSQLGQG
ncbi:MAG: rhodanese-like domain-containing protein [Planctomycetota bacterium]